jgi:hypothetical protein
MRLPMTPVDASMRLSGLMPSSSAAAPAVRMASHLPQWPQFISGKGSACAGQCTSGSSPGAC